MTADDIGGWCDYEALLFDVIKNAKDGDEMVEVGCWVGKSTAHAGQYIKESGKKIVWWAVDHGFGTDSQVEASLHAGQLTETGGNIAGRFVKNLRDCDVLDFIYPLIVPSIRAATRFKVESLAFVFIDAAHDKVSVLADIAAWWPKIRPGGMLAGHDISQGWTGVRQAVEESFESWEINPLSPSCWSVRKP